MPATVDLELLTRPACSLCVKARSAFEEAARDLGVAISIHEVDIDADPALRKRYGLRIPVVRRSGLDLCEGVIRPAEARSALVASA